MLKNLELTWTGVKVRFKPLTWSRILGSPKSGVTTCTSKGSGCTNSPPFLRSQPPAYDQTGTHHLHWWAALTIPSRYYTRFGASSSFRISSHHQLLHQKERTTTRFRSRPSDSSLIIAPSFSSRRSVDSAWINVISYSFPDQQNCIGLIIPPSS